MSFVLASAVAAGAALQLTVHMRIAESRLDESAARNKAGYCVNTIRIAMRFVSSQAPPEVGRAVSA